MQQSHESLSSSETPEVENEETTLNNLHSAVWTAISKMDPRETLTMPSFKKKKELLPSACIKGFADGVTGKLLGICVGPEENDANEQPKGSVPIELHVSIDGDKADEAGKKLPMIGRFAIHDLICNGLGDAAKRNLYDIAGRLNELEGKRTRS